MKVITEEEALAILEERINELRKLDEKHINLGLLDSSEREKNKRLLRGCAYEAAKLQHEVKIIKADYSVAQFLQ